MASAFATFAFVVLFAFNFAYVNVPLAPADVVLKTPDTAVVEKEVPVERVVPSDSAQPRAALSVQRAPAEAVQESSKADEPSEAPPSGMAAVMFEVETVPSPSPFTGYEWPVLAVAVVLILSTLGLWLGRIRG